MITLTTASHGNLSSTKYSTVAHSTEHRKSKPLLATIHFMQVHRGPQSDTAARVCSSNPSLERPKGRPRATQKQVFRAGLVLDSKSVGVDPGILTALYIQQVLSNLPVLSQAASISSHPVISMTTL